MPRLNIEESIWIDPRFSQLTMAIGCQFKAIGSLVYAWRIAQGIHRDTGGRGGIPKAKWKALNLPDEIIKVGLASERGGLIYMAGQGEAFEWLINSQNSGKQGGKISAENKRKKLQGSSRVFKGFEPSSSSSSSISSSFSPSSVLSERATPEKSNPVGELVAAYRRAFTRRYGPNSKPDVRGQVIGQMQRLLGEVPLARAIELVETYCGMNDRWFITKAHDFGTLMQNIGKVQLALDTGRAPTADEARDAERMSGTLSQLERIKRGEL